MSTPSFSASRPSVSGSATSSIWDPSNHMPPAPTNDHFTSDPSNLPHGSKSLSGISMRAFIMGNVMGIAAAVSVYLFFSTEQTLWRLSIYIAMLCLFHFLEYWVTARYNTDVATTDAYLLTQNGWAYNIAHMIAISECLMTRLFCSEKYFARTALPFGGIYLQTILGFFLVILGQTIRTVAMAQAGPSFNHTVQARRKETHILVQHGVYSVLRHPSYFGFYWWALGTQMVLGNVVTFSFFALALWKFFASRIYREEQLLIKFFGDDYVEYRKHSWIGIPFLW